MFGKSDGWGIQMSVFKNEHDSARQRGESTPEGTTDWAKARTLSHGCVSCQVSLKRTLQNTRSGDTRRYWVRTGFRGRVSLTNVRLDEASAFQRFPSSVLTRTVGPDLMWLCNYSGSTLHRTAVLGTSGRVHHLTKLGHAGRLPVLCELNCVSALAVVGVWVLPRESKCDLLTTPLKSRRVSIITVQCRSKSITKDWTQKPRSLN